ncbi:MAG: outer membrane beta-barrel protein [Nitrospirae bacterium]|nr:outer membrane beta-barrel protein [Nitrospirota bacterium]
MDVLKFSNKKSLLSLILAMAFFLVQGILGSALAEKVDTDSILKRLEIVEKTAGEDSIAKKLDLSLYGYVETSYTQNFNNPSTGANQHRSFDGDSNSFRPNMAQLVLERAAKGDGSVADRAGFRMKLNFGEDAKFTGGSGADDFDFQEAFVQYVTPIGRGLTIQGGRMNTLIGYEVIESPLNPNFSRSFLFGIGEPFTVTGVRGSYDFSDSVSFAISGINSFTGAQQDGNNRKSVEALLSMAPTDNLGVSIFGFWGPEGLRGVKNADRVQIGGIIDLQVTDQAEIVVEAYYGNQANASRAGGAQAAGKNARWNGVAGYFIYDFNDQWGARFRSEIFEDAAGFFNCGGGTGGPGGVTATGGNAQACFGGVPVAQTLWETTYTLQYKPIPSMITRLEFRYDKSDKNTFQDGAGPANNQQTLAIDAIFLF